MVCCSANWGAGGYLVARHATNSDEDAPGQAGSTTQAPTIGKVELSLVEATLVNRKRAAVFRVVDCDGLIAQPYIGGRLLRPPPKRDANTLAERGRSHDH